MVIVAQVKILLDYLPVVGKISVQKEWVSPPQLLVISQTIFSRAITILR